jgi:beta-glucosidase
MQQMQAQTQRRRMEDMRRRADQQQEAQQAARLAELRQQQEAMDRAQLAAKKAALEAMTLYKNEKSTLPLSDSKVKTLALVGPQGPNAGLLFGNYAGSANGGNWGMSIEQGLTARLAKSGGKVVQVDGLASIGADNSTDNFAAAAAAAKAADVTVVTLGLAFDSYCDKSSSAKNVCEREGDDREEIELPAGQVAMVAALRKAIGPDGKLVAVLIHGGSMAFSDETLGALDAVLDAW